MHPTCTDRLRTPRHLRALLRPRVLIALTLILALTVPLGIPATAFAATQQFEAVRFNKDGRPYQPVTGSITGNGYPVPVPMVTSFFYRLANDRTKVAYCLTAGFPNPGGNRYPESYQPSRAVRYVVINGYPTTRTIMGTSLSPEAARVATQVSLWVVLGQIRIASVKAAPGYPEGPAIVKAVRALTAAATNGALPYSLSWNLPSAPPIQWHSATHRRVGPLTVTAGYGLTSLSVAVANISGARIVNASGTTIVPKSGQPFYVLVPVSAMTSPGTRTLSATAQYETPSILAWDPPSGVRAQDMLAYYAPNVESATRTARIAWGTIDVSKADSLTGRPVGGTIIELRQNGVALQRLTTDAAGRAVFNGVPYGAYELVEVKANPYYLMPTAGSSEAVRAVRVSATTPAPTVVWKNTPITGEVRVVKTDAVDGSAVAGARFEVRHRLAGQSWKAIASGITDAKGRLTLAGVPIPRPGETAQTLLIETAAPRGYRIAAGPERTGNWPVTLTLDRPMATVEVAEKRITGSLSVLKLSGSSEGGVLADTVFEVRRIPDSTTRRAAFDTTDEETFVARLVTDARGRASISGLEYGSYRLVEVEAATGFVLDKKPHPFTIRSHGTTVALDVVNDPITGGVSLLKSSALDGSALTGVVFEVARMVSSETTDGLVADIESTIRLVTGDDGRAELTGLEFGTYRLTEVETVDGYVLDPTPRSFTIDGLGEIVTFELENEPIRGGVSVRKTSAHTGSALAGTVFEVLPATSTATTDSPESPDPVAVLTTDPAGRASHEGLLFGGYLLVESVSSPGHVLDPSPYPFTIDEHGETVSFDLTNEPVRGSVTVTKKSALDGAPLSGVSFEIHTAPPSSPSDSVGPAEPVAMITTDSSGRARLDGLPFGKYALVETASARGHLLDPTPRPFEIGEQDEAVTFELANEPVMGGVSVRKSSSGGGGRPLPGVAFEVHRALDTADSGESLVGRMTTDDSGYAEHTELPFGDYYLVETKPATGHAIDPTRRYFSISEHEGMIPFELTNDVIDIDHGGVMVRYRHIWDRTEIAPAWGFNAEIGSEYLPRLIEGGWDRKPIEGYTYVRADYPDEERLIDGKLLVTYWYKKDLEPGWTPLIKTGDDGSAYLPKRDRDRLGLLSREALFSRLMDAKSVNPDVIGYLSIPGTDLHEPVVQTSDNHRYLHTDAHGADAVRGAIFADHRSDPYIGGDEHTTILHGHNMRDGSMFGVLGRFGDPAFLAEHPVVQYIDAAGRGGTWAIYAAHPSDGDDAVFDFPATTDSRTTQIRAIKDSVITTGLETVSTEAELLTLSTCAYHVPDGKLLVHARLLDDEGALR